MHGGCPAAPGRQRERHCHLPKCGSVRHAGHDRRTSVGPQNAPHYLQLRPQPVNQGTGIVAVLYGQFLVGGLAFALAGTAAGFLWHNWAPATVHLGDAGASFLGFLLAIVTLRLRPVGLKVPWIALIPMLLVFVPLIDTTFVVVHRTLAGRHPFTPGRDHPSHAHLNLGLTLRQSVNVLQMVLVMSDAGAVALARSFR